LKFSGGYSVIAPLVVSGGGYRITGYRPGSGDAADFIVGVIGKPQRAIRPHGDPGKRSIVDRVHSIRTNGDLLGQRNGRQTQK
jgi:hypothetical protein